jgi:hypothetical protein
MPVLARRGRPIGHALAGEVLAPRYRYSAYFESDSLYDGVDDPFWRCLVVEAGYTLDDGTVVHFEFEPGAGFRPTGAMDVVGRIREAVTPAIEGAKVVLEKAKEGAPDEVEVKFGIKVTGTANWFVAKASTDGTFEVTMKWKSTGVAAGA